MTSDCPQSQRRHTTKGHKLNSEDAIPPASCLLSLSWEDCSQQANTSSSTAMLSTAIACSATFSGEKGHYGSDRGKGRRRKCWLLPPWSWDSNSYHPNLRVTSNTSLKDHWVCGSMVHPLNDPEIKGMAHARYVTVDIQNTSIWIWGLSYVSNTREGHHTHTNASLLPTL